jgi:predicted nucleic acid-binding protein
VNRYIIDTGPIVALLNRRDRYNAWIRGVLDTIEPPLSTAESVVSKAAFLLSRVSGGVDALLTLLCQDVLRIEFQAGPEASSLQTLVRKYESVPMSFADACLVRMSELEPDSVVITLDGDFKVYRRNRRRSIPTIMPT